MCALALLLSTVVIERWSFVCAGSLFDYSKSGTLVPCFELVKASFVPVRTRLVAVAKLH